MVVLSTILSLMVIVVDFLGAAFIIWRISDKKATLWGTSRIIYGWIALLMIYHGIIYIISFFHYDATVLILEYLHPFVLFYVLNPILIALIHWRGGRLI